MDADTQVYLLKLAADEEGGVRIELRDASGEVRYFPDLEGVLAHLRSRCQGGRPWPEEA